MEKNDKLRRFYEEASIAFSGGRLINITFSVFPEGEILKVKGTPRIVSKRTVLQLEYSLTEGRVRHENVPPDNVAQKTMELLETGCKNCQLNCTDGTASFMRSSIGAVNTTYKLGNKVTDYFPVLKNNDTEKNYIFDGGEDFLKELAVSDGRGRVHDKKQSKFRQINRFAEQVRDIMKYLPTDGPLKVYDLCCGKSYLSFAVYSYLVNRENREVDMICADLKASVIENRCPLSARPAVSLTVSSVICSPFPMH